MTKWSQFFALAALGCSLPAWGQADQARAAGYFQEAAALCAQDGGRMWGVSLCGPMTFVDATTHTMATNQTAPSEKQPATFGFANAAMLWGGVRWTTMVWQITPQDRHLRARLMLHELFH